VSLSLVLVVPCFDEANRFDAKAFAEGLDADPSLSLVLVDDGSRDGTRALLESFARDRAGRVDVVTLPENRGKGEAVRAGLLAALSKRPTFAGWWDADLSTPLSEARRLVSVLEAKPSAFLAMGSRVRMVGTRIDRRFSRHLFGRVVATWISRTLRLPTYDTQCGAKVFRAASSPAGLFDAPFETRWLFDVEVLARLERLHRDGKGPPPEDRVAEVPVLEWRDVAGSKVSPLDFLRARAGLRRIRARYGISAPRR
jgi:glycosyltransferase involved in cell wall biosynthesis